MKLLPFLFLVVSFIRGNFAAYEFSLSKFQNCPVNQTMKMYVNINNTVALTDKILYSGYMEVSREVRGPLELSIETNRCDVDMRKCEKNPTLKFTGLCEKLKDTKTFYYASLSGLTPSLKCPVLPQRYTATNSSMLDLSPIAFLPIGGYIWLVTVKMTSSQLKRRELVLCTMFEISIAKAKRKRRN